MSFINNNKYFKESISETLKKMGYSELVNDEQKDKIFYCDVDYNKRTNPTYQKCEIVNQLENVNPLGNKKQQYDLHLKYYKTRPEYIPFTLAFNRDSLDNLNPLFDENNKKIYILKPENDSFRNGCGLVESKEQLIEHLEDYDIYDDWIIQDYIDDPLLLNNKKFHFRIYVIYIQSKDFQAAYLCRNGFIYTANKEFEKGTFDNDVVLSGESSPANVFYVPEDFQKHFGKKVWDDVVHPQIVKMTRETLKSVLELLKCPLDSQKCFKILGYDILIDKDYKCYLAEINARGVTYKYPNQKFLDTFYKNILKLVLAKEPLTNKELKAENIPYERILFKKDGVVTEGFSGLIRYTPQNELDKNINFNNFYWKILYPFLFIVLILILVQVHLKR